MHRGALLRLAAAVALLAAAGSAHARSSRFLAQRSPAVEAPAAEVGALQGALQGAAGGGGRRRTAAVGRASKRRPLTAHSPSAFSLQYAPNVTAMSGPHLLGGSVVGAVADAVADAVAPWLPSGRFSGDGTAFSEAVANTGAGFACSYRYLNDWASHHFAAINKPMVRRWRLGGGGRWVLAGGWWRLVAAGGCCPAAGQPGLPLPLTLLLLTPLPPAPRQWDEGRACGRCLTAWCVDERCAVRNKRVQVMVTDLCPECKEGARCRGGGWWGLLVGRGWRPKGLGQGSAPSERRQHPPLPSTR